MHAPPRALAALVLSALAVGCSPTPQTTPAASSAQPTYLCTGGTQTATPFPCDKARYDDQQRTKALEDEALAVYQRYWKEYTRLIEAGGTTEATPELQATVAEPMLATIVAVLRFQSKSGWRPRPLVARSVVEVMTMPTRTDADLSLVACEDTTGSVMIDSAGNKAAEGSMAVNFLALRRVGGALKIYDVDGQPTGTPCPVR